MTRNQGYVTQPRLWSEEPLMLRYKPVAVPGRVKSPNRYVDENTSLDESKVTVAPQLRATTLNSWAIVLFYAAPARITLHVVKAKKIAVFTVNLIAIISLATKLIELIVAVIELAKKEVLVVQSSLLRSNFLNFLLVLGMCCFFGGIGRVEQHFNVTAAQTTASLPAPAGGSLIIPMAFYQLTPTTDGGKASSLSRGTSVFLLITYGCYLLFQLKARVEIYNRPSPKTGKRCQRIAKGDSKCRNDQIAKMAAASMEVNAQQAQMQDRDDEPEQLQLTILVALITRDVLPAIVAVYAEFMVSSIDALPATGDIGRTFVGPVLLRTYRRQPRQTRHRSHCRLQR
ncbi:hypothetical protein N7508_011122 [Penicillium antarcticum]|uniref:uncharacterized protein n=1 Tax=Penicillium antarcticum TaxID=416450 RepID=UPI002384E50A|nr:uncharacterized protein N7508_011122 [Penicillium antarcticum]KAJ5288347.1 hypothetical protein N7508_011122 [Penicillium antarcticum]